MPRHVDLRPTPLSAALLLVRDLEYFVSLSGPVLGSAGPRPELQAPGHVAHETHSGPARTFDRTYRRTEPVLSFAGYT